MEIEYDLHKSKQNIKNRGMSFELARDFEMDVALVKEDSRFVYREQRFNAIGPIGDRLYHLSFTYRGDVIRVISLRLAEKAEVMKYVQSY